MQIRLTVHAARSSGERVDVLVSAQPGATLSTIAGALRSAVGGSQGDGRIYAGDVEVGPDAPLGMPPLLDGALLHLDVPGAPTNPTGELELHVVGGPDAGGVHLLTPGQHGPALIRLGRSTEAEVRLDDPDVSRLHVELGVERDWITVRDLGSTNGTTLDGKPVDDTPTVMLPGALLRIGESAVTVALGQTASGGRPDGSGRVEVDRVMRREIGIPEPRVELPARPSARGLPAKRKRTLTAFREERLRAEQAIATALTTEARLRRESTPDPAAALVSVLRPGPRLWERRREDEDALELRLGTARLPSRVSVSAGERTLRPRVPGVPVTIRLDEARVLGLVGPRPALDGLARWLVAQLATLSAPHDVDLVLLVDDDDPDRWRWARWLPHLRPADGQNCRLLVGLTTEQILARIAELTTHLVARGKARDAAGPWRGRRTIVLVDPAARLCGPGRPGGLATLLDKGPDVGIHAICLAEHPDELPEATGAVVTLGGEVTTRLRVEPPQGPVLDGIVADLVPAAWAERFARGLAPLREASSGQQRPLLPEQVRLLDLLHLDLLTPAKLAERWNDEAATAREVLVLGSGSDTALAVDLGAVAMATAGNRDVSIAGVSGSGVSELVAAAVCGLAAANRPDRLTMLLATADDSSPLTSCEGLPHVAGHIRLAELAGGTTSAIELLSRPLDALLRGGTASSRILLAIDDLQRWAQHAPTLLDELAARARDFRARGLRMILGTVVGDSPDASPLDTLLCRDAAIRVALRLPDPMTARAVVGEPGPEVIDATDPGRGVVRLPDGTTRQLRAPRISGRMPSTATLRATVLRQNWRDLGDPLPRQADAPGGPTDLALLVGAARRAATQLGLSRS